VYPKGESADLRGIWAGTTPGRSSGRSTRGRRDIVRSPPRRRRDLRQSRAGHRESTMPSRTLLPLSIAVVAVGGVLWFLSRPAEARCESAERARLSAGGAAATGGDEPLAARDASESGSAPLPVPPTAPVEPIVADDCSVRDHLDELVEDLAALAWSATEHDT